MAFDGRSEHYSISNIEPIDVIEEYELNFSLGNVIKYVLRCGHKGNEKDSIKDLEKAKSYLEREILRRKKEIVEKSNTDNNQEDYNNDQDDLYARKKEKTI